MTASDQDPNHTDSLTPAQALDNILATVQRIEERETKSLIHAFGRVLSSDVQAPLDVPGFRNSAMDGFAYNSNGRPAEQISGSYFKLVGQSLAGHPFEGQLAAGECLRITTGAMVPDTADTVVMQENTTANSSSITVNKAPEAGFNVRDRGSNIARNSCLLKQGTTLGAAEIGVLASSGINEIEVVRKLKVAFFSTGDELAEPGTALLDGQIFDSNRYLLGALLNNPGIEIIDLGIVADSKQALQDCMQLAGRADVAISSGGVSVGDADYVREVLQQQGSVNLWKILMKPGRPLTHGALSSGTCYFGLPGNPVSGIVTFYQFVLPSIRKMFGKIEPLELTFSAKTTSKLVKEPGRMELQRGILFRENDQEWQVKTTGLQDSHVLTSMCQANCFIVLAQTSMGAELGEQVEVIPFSNYQGI